MNTLNATDVTLEDHTTALNEVSFLMDIFASTIDNIMGGATAPVGRIAGREMARKLPINLNNPALEDVIGILSARMKGGFEFSLEGSGEDTGLVFDRCALRDVCALRGLQTGTALCHLFHSYFDGIVNELICRPVKTEIISCDGPQCRLKIRVQ
ncbi:MAG: hypothetical protein RW306_13670 [Geobacteraceae bacterium]|nr:hypothetical protein [Geobacteraceae bacterium]